MQRVLVKSAPLTQGLVMEISLIKLVEFLVAQRCKQEAEEFRKELVRSDAEKRAVGEK